MTFWRDGLRLLNSPSMIAGARLGQSMLALITLPITARVLGPEGRGLQATILATLIVVQAVLSLGTPLALRRRVSAGHRQADVVATGRLYVSFLFMPAIVFALIIDSLIFYSLPISVRVAFYVSMILIPLTISWSMHASILVATHEYRRIGTLNLIPPIINLILILCAWMSGLLNVATAVYATLIGNLAAFCISFCWMRVRGGRAIDMKLLVKEGGSLAGGIFAEIASKRVDQMIVLPLLGARSAGIYSVAVTIGMLPIAVSRSLGAAVFNNLTTGDQDFVRLSVRYAFALSLIGAVSLGAIAYFLIPVVFGAEFRAAVPVAMIALGGSVFAGSGFVCTMALAAQRRGAQMTGAQIVGAVVGVGLLYPFSEMWGVIGAALAISTGPLVTTVILLVFLKVSPAEAVPRPTDAINALRTLFNPGRS